MVNIHLILASLRRQGGLFGIWIFCLSLAVTGLLVVDLFRASLTTTLRQEGRKILSGDMAVSARRILNEKERRDLDSALPPTATRSHVTEMLAMLSHTAAKGPQTRLVSLRFIDDNYPLIGDLEIETVGSAEISNGKALNAQPTVWLSRDLASLLQLGLEQTVRIGNSSFQTAGWIAKDSTQTFRMGGMAPRVYVHRRFLENTGLMQLGSTFSESHFFRLPSVTDVQSARELKLAIEKKIQDPAIQVTVPTDLEQGPFRVLSRLMDYLGLVGLVTLCLGWTGVLYLGRRWLAMERTAVGTLKSLGLTTTELRRLLLGKLVVILSIGVVIGGAVAWLAALSLTPLVQDSMPSGFSLAWSWSSTLVLVLIGPLCGGLLLLPALNALINDDPLVLIQDRAESSVALRDLIVHGVLLCLLLGAMTLIQARSWYISAIFLGALIGTVAVITGVAYLAIRLLRGRSQNLSWPWHLSLSLWTRRANLAVLLVTVSALAGLLSQLVPHLEKSIVIELSSPTAVNRPALFLFDLQDEQMSDFTKMLAQENIPISESAPFIRARILKVNEQEFERAQAESWSTREEEMDARFRNRGVNITYREHLPPGDQILSGKSWDELSAEGAVSEISVEQGYADRLGLKLGDVLSFDIQGIELKASIANIRQVDWNRFEPNFFITFKPGVLEEAPKTWIMTVRQHATLTPAEMQAKIVSRFPNVTSINVRETIDNLTELFGKLSLGLKIASGLCLGLGVFVYLMILLFQLSSSRRDWQQLRILGLNSQELLRVQFISHFTLAVVGLAFGSALSLQVAWAVAHFGFKSKLQMDWYASVQILAVSALLAAIGSILISKQINRRTDYLAL